MLSSWVWIRVRALLVIALCSALTVCCVVAWIYETLNLFSGISLK
jgi:hypothetical protein